MIDEPADQPPPRPSRAARGIMLALLLSAPVWFGLAVAIWRMTEG